MNRKNELYLKIHDAIKHVCELKGYEVADVMGRNREYEFKILRRDITFAIYDLFIQTPRKAGAEPILNLTEIARMTQRNHATIIHIRETCKSLFKIYKDDYADYLYIKKHIADFLNIQTDDVKPDSIDNVKRLWIEFRLAERQYDINTQAKVRKKLDAIFNIAGVKIEASEASETSEACETKESEE